jgi:hypothetical protein
MARLVNGEIHLSEATEIRWFEKLPRCGCGKTATGILRGTQNQSFGHHCDGCATKRLKASAKERESLAKLLAEPSSHPTA